MPVFESGYRRYEGELARSSPLPLMTWHNIRPRLRWWVWVLTGLLLFYPFVVWAVLIYMVLVLGTAVGMPPGTVPTEAFAGSGANPAVVLSLLGGDGNYLCWELMSQTWLANIVIPAVTCAGILARDRTSGAMQLYFARPITRVHYMLSKVLAVMAFSFLVTCVPTLLIWGECVTFGSVDFLKASWSVPFRVVSASLLLGLWTSALVLALSATFRRPVVVGIAALLLGLVVEAAAAIATGISDIDALELISPYRSLGSAIAPLFGLTIPEEYPPSLVILVAFGLPVVLLAYTWRRIRAVEIVT